jgi:type IV pilus assembly protein PilC
MPRFTYVARDKDGKKKTASMEASDETAVVLKLQSQGFFVIKVFSDAIDEKDVKKLQARQKVQKFSHGRVKLNDIVIFARQLATMLDAGITLLKTLDVIKAQIESKTLYNAVTGVRNDLERGLSFSNALAKYPRIFSKFWVSLVEVGEASGSLPTVLERMANFLEEKAEFQRKIISSLMYPGVLLVICTGATSFFAFKIIPKFTEIFSSFGVELPALTQAIVGFFEFIRTKFFLILLGVSAIIILFRNYTRTTVGRRQVESVLFQLPVVGKFLKIMAIERFASQMAILVESGVPILYALEITQRMVGSSIMEGVIENVKRSAREGQLIADAMSKSGFFTPMVVQMVLIGEETGELGVMLNKIASFYESYISTFVERLTTLFEPIMLVFMGAVIGTIVISMFLPIFSIATIGG